MGRQQDIFEYLEGYIEASLMSQNTKKSLRNLVAQAKQKFEQAETDFNRCNALKWLSKDLKNCNNGYWLTVSPRLNKEIATYG